MLSLQVSLSQNGYIRRKVSDHFYANVMKNMNYKYAFLRFSMTFFAIVDGACVHFMLQQIVYLYF